MQFATLVLRAETQDLRRAKGDLESLRTSGARAERDVTGSMSRTSKGFDGVAGSARRMAGAVAAATAALGSAGVVLRSAQQYQSLSNGLRGMGMSADQAAAALDSVAGIANSTRAPLEATAQLYRRISVASGELGASQKEVLRFTENIGLALASSGTSANEASGALLQLSQAMAGGVVRAEEFNSILEGAFPIAQAAARGIDEAAGSVGRLRQLVVEGQISSDEFFHAILSQTAELQAAFANTVPTIGQAVTVLGNNFTMLSGRMDATLGVSSSVAQGILVLADNLDRVAIYAGTAAVVLGGAYATSVALAAARTLTFSGALVTLRGALLRTGVFALVLGAGELVFQFSRLVRATGSWGSALDLLGRVASGVWMGITASAKAIPVALGAVWSDVESGFFDMLSHLTETWSRFLGGIGQDLAGIAPLSAVSKSVLRMSGEAAASVSEFDARSQAAARSAAGLREEASSLATQGFDRAKEAAAALRAAVAETGGSTDGATEAAGRLNSGLDTLSTTAGGSSRAVEALAEEIQQLEFNANPVKKYRAELAKLDALLSAGLSSGAHRKAVQDLNDELANSIPMVTDVADAWGDFVSRGFRDFDDFVGNVLDSFQNMLSTMIATAARNRILIGMGVAATPSVAAASPGGLFGGGGGLLGGAGNLLGLNGLVGGGGLLGGIGSGLGGVFSGGGLGSSFANLGGLLSGSAGGLGAIGAALPALGIIAGAAALLSNALSREYAGTAIRGTFGAGGFDGQEFDFYRGGALRSDRAYYRDLDAELQAQLDQTVQGISGNVEQMAAALGLGSEAIHDFATDQFTIWTNGRSQEEIAQALQEQMDGLAVGMSDLVLTTDQFTRSGETSHDALTRLSSSLTAFNAIADTLGHTLYASSLYGGDMASELVDLFGGLDALNAATTNYYQSFYSEAERVETLTRQTSAALSELGIAMPRTRAEYRRMVEALDLTTAHGREVYATLIGVSGAMNDILPELASFTAEIAVLAGSLSTDIGAMISETSSAQRASEQAASLWYRTSQTLRDVITDLRSTSGALVSVTQARAFSEMRFQTLLGGAMAGDNQAATDLPAAARALLENASATAHSRVDLARIEARVLAGISDAAGVSDIEGARHDVIAGLQGQQVALLESIRSTINTGADISAEIIDGLNAELSSLNAAIQSAEMINYAFLSERLNVTVDLLASANVPEDVRRLIANAQQGVQGSIEFIVRDQMTPDQRWLALTGVSEHIRTIEFVVTDLPDARTQRLALDTVGTLNRSIRLLSGNQLSDDEMRVALAGNSELARVVNVALSSQADQRAIRLALANAGTYAVAVNASLSAPPEVRQIVFNNGGSYAAMVEAAFSQDLDPDVRRVLLQEQGRYAVSVMGTLRSDTSAAMQSLLLEASTTAVRGITVSLAWADAVDDAERELLLVESRRILRSIEATVTPRAMTPLGRRLLDQLHAGTGIINRTLNGAVDLGALNRSQIALLEAVQGNSTGTLRLVGTFVFDPAASFSTWYGTTTRELISTPMSRLSDGLSELSQLMREEAARARAEAELRERVQQIAVEAAEVQSGLDQHTQRGGRLIDAANALMSRTGTVAYDASGAEATLRQAANGSIIWNGASVTSRDFAAFRAGGFWGAGGIQQQFGQVNRSIAWSERELDRLRAQVISVGGIPHFQHGGVHKGGWRVVGEAGPELEYTGPSRVVSSAESRRLLDNSDLIQELRELRREVAQARAENRALLMKVNSTQRKASNTLQGWDKTGLPKETTT